MKGNTTTPPNKSIPCPHLDGNKVCWVCVENGYTGHGSPPMSEKHIVVNTPPLEVLPPGEGIEVGAPGPYPGIEVIAGPDHTSWSTEPEHKSLFISKPPTILGVRRRWFWIVLVGLLVVLLIGGAIGAAVGVTQSRRPADTAAAVTSPAETIASSATSSTISSITEGGVLISTSILIQSTTTLLEISYSSQTSITTSSTTVEEQTSSTPVISSSTPTELAPTATATTTILVTPSVSSPTTTTTPPPPPPTTTPTPTPTTNPPTSTSTSTSAQPTSSTITLPNQTNGHCLGPNGSTFTDASTSAQFRIECSVAHQGKDIENLEAESMEECVSFCAQNTRCVGAIWYNVGPQGTDLNYCWLKRTLDDSDIRDTGDAQSVVRL